MSRQSARRWTGSRLERDAEPAPRSSSTASQHGWSPEQIAGRLAREQGRNRYQLREHLSLHLRPDRAHQRRLAGATICPRQEQTRLTRPPRRQLRKLHQRPVSIAQRPPEAADRPRPPGHWEADLMLFTKYGQAILAVHERKSAHPVSPAGRTAKPPSRIARQLLACSQPCRPIAPDRHLRQRHRVRPTIYRLTRPRHPNLLLRSPRPWQKGGIENAIGRMRRFLPRKTDLATLSAQTLPQLSSPPTTTPRENALTSKPRPRSSCPTVALRM